MEDLNLETAQGMPGQGCDCRICRTPIQDHYYMAGANQVCDKCLERHYSGGKGLRALGRATAVGGVGAILGALLDFLVTHFSGYQIGLIAIVMGWLVGAGVSIGARGRGGKRFQLLAFVLTYLAISLSLVGQVSEALMKEQPEPQATVSASPAPDVQASPSPLAGASAQTARATATPKSPSAPEPANDAPVSGREFVGAMFMLAGLFLALPVLVGIEAPISLLIYGFALYQAVAMNRRLEVSGPFQVAPQADPETPADAPDGPDHD